MLESKEKEQTNAAMLGMFSDILTNPQKLQGLIDLANNPVINKKN